MAARSAHAGGLHRKRDTGLLHICPPSLQELHLLPLHSTFVTHQHVRPGGAHSYVLSQSLSRQQRIGRQQHGLPPSGKRSWGIFVSTLVHVSDVPDVLGVGSHSLHDAMHSGRASADLRADTLQPDVRSPAKPPMHSGVDRRLWNLTAVPHKLAHRYL